MHSVVCKVSGKKMKLSNHDPSKNVKAYLINQPVATVKANHGKSIST